MERVCIEPVACAGGRHEPGGAGARAAAGAARGGAGGERTPGGPECSPRDLRRPRRRPHPESPQVPVLPQNIRHSGPLLLPLAGTPALKEHPRDQMRGVPHPFPQH